MNIEKVKELALANGFKLKEQASGNIDLNAYVYDFANAIEREVKAQADAELYGTGFLKVTYDSNEVKYERLDTETISMCSSNIDLDSQVLKEWQPDWSQAPEWAKWWYVTDKNNPKWCSKKPYQDGCNWFVGANETYSLYNAPSFGYTGNWQDSLRERPQ